MNDTRHQTVNLRREDDRLATGRGSYTDDMRHDGALHIAFVRSLHAAAIIRSIDTAAALAHPGVVAVPTGPAISPTTGARATLPKSRPLLRRRTMSRD